MHVRMAEVMTGIVLAFVVITIGQYGYNAYDRMQPAVEWVDGKAIGDTVKKGGVLHINYRAIIHKQCPSDLQHFLVAPDGSSPVRFPTTNGGYTKASKSPVDIPVRVEIPLTPDKSLANYPIGDYIYRAIATRYCENGIQVDAAIPDVQFALEE